MPEGYITFSHAVEPPRPLKGFTIEAPLPHSHAPTLAAAVKPSQENSAPSKRPPRQTSDDFLERLAKVEDMPSRLVMPLLTNNSGTSAPIKSASKRTEAELHAKGAEAELSSAEPIGNAIAPIPAPLAVPSVLTTGCLAADTTGTTINGTPVDTDWSPDLEAMSSRSGIAVLKGARKLEMSVIDHPRYDGVLVCALGKDGACRAKGICVGHHIRKINDIRVNDHKTAMWLVDAAETRVRFSLGEALVQYAVDRTLGDVGITLVNNTTAGVGVVVAHIEAGLAADKAGIEVGHEILAVEDQLAHEHKEVIKAIDEANGRVVLHVAARKITEHNVLNQAIGQVPVEIIVF